MFRLSARGNRGVNTLLALPETRSQRITESINNWRIEMTTKVRITNIVEDNNAHSNGDVVIHGLGAVPVIVAPGESTEHWLAHGEIPTPIVVHERWPSQKKKDAG